MKQKTKKRLPHYSHNSHENAFELKTDYVNENARCRRYKFSFNVIESIPPLECLLSNNAIQCQTTARKKGGTFIDKPRIIYIIVMNMYTKKCIYLDFEAMGNGSILTEKEKLHQ